MDRELIKIRNRFIIVDLLIAIILMIFLTGMIFDNIYVYMINGVIFILLLACIFFTWILHQIAKIDDQVDSLPEEQKEKKLREIYNKSLILRMLLRIIDRFTPEGERIEIEADRIILNEDGLNFFMGDQSVFRIIPLFRIKRIGYYHNKRVGNGFFIFKLKDKTDFSLHAPFTKPEAAKIYRNIKKNIKKHRSGKGIETEEYAGKYEIVYYENKSDQ